MLSTQILWYWLHLIGVIIWAGGFFYLVLSFVPAINAGAASQDRSAIIRQAAARFRRVSWFAIGLIAVTGVFNFVERVSIAQEAQLPAGGLLPRGYMPMLGVKLVIFIGLIVHHATRLLEPREQDDGRVRMKSKAVVIVTSVLFIMAVLLGLALITI